MPSDGIQKGANCFQRTIVSALMVYYLKAVLAMSLM